MATSVLADWAVVLVRTQGPINLGMILRACHNLGVGSLRLVQPLCAVDCDDSRKFANHVRGELARLPVHTDLAAALGDRDLVIGTTARTREAGKGGPLDLREIPDQVRARGARRPALVFGNEADGLSEDELGHCQCFLRLITPGDYPSYNLSHAVAICCHHLALAAEVQSEAGPALADQEDRARLTAYWLDTLERFRYFRRSPRERFEPQFRRLLDRCALTRKDCEVLRGMFAQFNYHRFGQKFDGSHATGEPDREDAPAP